MFFQSHRNVSFGKLDLTSLTKSGSFPLWNTVKIDWQIVLTLLLCRLITNMIIRTLFFVQEARVNLFTGC
jgi:hypothetical protein